MTNTQENFIPSEYQRLIFDCIEHGTENIVVNAVAGSGKTTTISKALELIPSEKNVLFIAFNKDIVETLKKKVGYLPNVKIMTYHALGYSIVCENLKKKPELNDYKYNTYIRSNISRFLQDATCVSKKSDIRLYTRNINKLIDYARFNLAQSENEVKQVAEKYKVPILCNECAVTVEVLQWGSHNTDTIDYTDMVWLPYELQWTSKVHKYDWVFVDEAQDSSLVQQELFKKCRKRGSRFCAVGDSDQCINAWAGADINAFNKFKKNRNTKEFDLPISYRCPQSIVDYAQKYSPRIKAKDGAEQGIIYQVVSPYTPVSGDMVLCRNTYPLVKLFADYLRVNKKAFIRGRDLGTDLINTIEHFSSGNNNLGKDLLSEGLFRNLYRHLITIAKAVSESSGCSLDEAYESEPVMMFFETIESINILSENVRTIEELINKVKAIFTDDADDEYICLSTIHKAKGLEANNVFLLAPSLIPSIYAKEDWELKQENNLMYVAITRAKKTLSFIDESKFDVIKSSIYYNSLKKKFKDIAVLLEITTETSERNFDNNKITIEKKIETIKAKKTQRIGAKKFDKFIRKN